MLKEDHYFKSIEKYFLTHLGRGIMLPYSDYELINEYKNKNIPLEAVTNGIREAFADPKNRDVFTDEIKFRSLTSVKKYIDDSIEYHLKMQPDQIDSSSDTSYPDNIINTINNNLSNVVNEDVRKLLIELRENLKSIKSSDMTEIFNTLTNQQEVMFDKIFNLLSDEEKNTIIEDCRKSIPGSSNLTSKAFDKSFKSFRNDLLREKFKITFIN